MEKSEIRLQRMSNVYQSQSSYMYLRNKMLLKIENTLLRSHRQRETTGIKKLYNSFFVLF
ncbi:uncharacterized protein LOC115771069 [Drosophila novamexicana]|uniref:Uncharacterized protein n=1 Tax=Drosophila pseudoobscura pseudoobscura TaxID=46245 RepID=A0A6I8VTK9_DROPS|nr:uncharacterized protein LOC113565159 [Drosophila persimilis]XP_030572484.1 uncharacterized protein LOC115771069 [Drosophila novamexicana]XP_032292556.1 uncharacterized protein LOC116651039 [Drosophila virilis]XP_033233989.1 uncharacterized protein LOC117183605 [Drosophila pseudoobscura]XP_033246300.1 uncharacterized protein LOC117187698 [Drosophila miranda]XP_033250438.1 uncharacterized protein LOC117189420 [Drosophila miranda]XP_034122494.1 uncharacterized protein LOC117580206 [Drosophila